MTSHKTLNVASQERWLTVFCGSSNSIDEMYFSKVRELGQKLSHEGWNLVYGGGTSGLMGELARTMKAAGSKVRGIIPSALMQRETSVVDEEVYGELITVNTMHERKFQMSQGSEAFIALPGGLGTLEELFEISTWNQLGIHDRPIVVYNINSFFDNIFAFLDTAVKEKFMLPGHRRIVIEAKSPDEVLKKIENYEAPTERYNLDWSNQ